MADPPIHRLLVWSRALIAYAAEHAVPGYRHLYVNVKVVVSSGGRCPTPKRPRPPLPQRLLRINEVAAETGLTTRAIRYYEEMGLLEPAARSEGDYRLYDASDLDRLTFIRSLRDDAGLLAGPDRPAPGGRGGSRTEP